MKRFAPLFLAFALVLAGCAGTTNVPLKKERAAQLAGKSVATTERERADFANLKASNMALGGLGGAVGGAIAGAASVKGGNELIARNAVPDPAVAIGRELASHLAGRLSVQPGAQTVPVKTTDAKELAAAGQAADLLLDVQTVNWSTIYLPTRWSHYRVLYSAKLRLIDTRKAETIAEGFFSWKTPDEGPFPTNDELYADNAKIFRELMEQATKAATDYFKREILDPK